MIVYLRRWKKRIENLIPQFVPKYVRGGWFWILLPTFIAAILIPAGLVFGDVSLDVVLNE